MDRITSSLVKEFSEQYGFEGDKDDRRFEKFATFCCVSHEYGDTFSPQDVWTGGEGDGGLDGVAIVVNGALIEDAEEVDDLIEANKYLDVTFVFVQAKSGRSFDSKEIGHLFYCVDDFLKEESTLAQNQAIRAKSDIASYIISKASYMIRRKPLCRLYFVTTGVWTNDANLSTRISNGVSDLKQLSLFESIEFSPIDADALRRLYSGTKEQVETEFNFPLKVTLPEIDGVEQAFLGTVSIEEYLRLITDEAGNIRRSLFYENVRDFQGDNNVNLSIGKTLKSDTSERFPILNNGVTIVARQLTTVGNKCTIRGYQIVNGCQTSHVIFNSKDQTKGEVQVPIRIIVTKSEEVRRSVIKSTNSQTAIKPENLAAMEDFQKKLEDYYSAFDERARLYYERRSRQYADIPGIEKVRIVTVKDQTKVFASMYLDYPHRASAYYGTLLKTLQNHLFGKDHDPGCYHLSALAAYKLDYLFRNNYISAKYKRFRYHMLMLFRHQNGNDVPPMNSGKKVKAYCTPLLELLNDSPKMQEAFKNTTVVFDEMGVTEIDSKRIKTQGFTEDVLKHIGSKFRR